MAAVALSLLAVAQSSSQTPVMTRYGRQVVGPMSKACKGSFEGGQANVYRDLGTGSSLCQHHVAR